MRTRRTRRIRPLLALLLISAVIPALVVHRAEAETPGGGVSVLDVTGRGSVSVEPDTARVTLSVSTISPKAAESVSRNAEITGRVIKNLKTVVGGDNVTTRGYRLYPEYEYNSETKKRELVGYRAVNAIVAETKELREIGRIIDITTQSGATSIENVSFRIENDEEWKRKALREAIEDAMGTANVAANASGVRILRILSISLGGAAPPVVMKEYQLRIEGARAKSPNTPIEPGDIVINATVRMRFEIGGQPAGKE